MANFLNLKDMVTKENVQKAGAFIGKQVIGTLIAGIAARSMLALTQLAKERNSSENEILAKGFKFLKNEISETLE